MSHFEEKGVGDGKGRVGSFVGVLPEVVVGSERCEPLIILGNKLGAVPNLDEWHALTDLVNQRIVRVFVLVIVLMLRWDVAINLTDEENILIEGVFAGVENDSRRLDDQKPAAEVLYLRVVEGCLIRKK